MLPSHEFIFHFNRSQCKSHKTVASKHAGEILRGGGLRAANVGGHAKTGTGNAIHNDRGDSGFFFAQADQQIEPLLMTVAFPMAQWQAEDDPEPRRFQSGIVPI